MRVYAIITCPNCGPSECKIHTTMKSTIRGGHDPDWEKPGAEVQYARLKARFDKGPVPCAECGAHLSLNKPSKEENDNE